jgi:hypothetical protein
MQQKTLGAMGSGVHSQCGHSIHSANVFRHAISPRRLIHFRPSLYGCTRQHFLYTSRPPHYWCELAIGPKILATPLVSLALSSQRLIHSRPSFYGCTRLFFFYLYVVFAVFCCSLLCIAYLISLSLECFFFFFFTADFSGMKSF